MEFDPKEIKVPQLHSLLLGAIGPRPIAFASTIDKNGNPNLAPFRGAEERIPTSTHLKT
jgi:hypothetical protein